MKKIIGTYNRLYPPHWIAWAESRGYKVEDMERIRFRSELDPRQRASEIHHIQSSFRGKRKDSPENLIALSKKEHDWVHAHSTRDTRDHLLSIVKKYAKDNDANLPNGGSEQEEEICP